MPAGRQFNCHVQRVKSANDTIAATASVHVSRTFLAQLQNRCVATNALFVPRKSRHSASTGRVPDLRRVELLFKLAEVGGVWAALADSKILRRAALIGFYLVTLAPG